MKKIVYLLAISFTFTLVLSACKSHERCPAYGQVAPTSQEIPS